MKTIALFILTLSIMACGKKNNNNNSGNGGKGSDVMFAEYDFVTGADPAKPVLKKVKGTIRLEKINDKTGKVTVVTEGNAPQDFQEFSMEGMPSREQVQEMTSDCAQLGAKFEEVETGAGRLPTCFRAEADGEKVWYGNVPFMMVKRIGKESVNGSQEDIEMTLKSYNW